MLTALADRLPEPDRKWLVAALLVAVHAVAVVGFLIDIRIPFAVLLAASAAILGFERPLAAVGLLIAGRITSTGATAWIRIGKMNIDLFEPSLLLAAGALMGHIVIQRKQVLADVPWRTPVLIFLAWQVCGLFWTIEVGECIKGIVATVILLATTMAILGFAEKLTDVRTLLWVWIGASLLVSLASFAGLGSSTTNNFEMASGSREGGFGQQPNWFAMNLMYGVMICVGLAIVEKNMILRVFFMGSAVTVFFAQMQSGSRGGTAAIMIAAGIASLGEPRIRKLVMYATPLIALVIVLVIATGFGDAANAFERVFSESSGQILGKSVRVSNWEVCMQMFRDTWGFGIGGGAGTYEILLAKYDWWLYNSQYTYPHGIFWGMMAHFGVVGLVVYAWFIGTVTKMAWDLYWWTEDKRLVDGNELRVLALCMGATMFGYFAWSFAEFNYDDKPFWEFLGLFSALWVIARTRYLALPAAALVAKSA